MMYDEDRNNHSETGYNDRSDEHIEARNTESQEVRSQQSFHQESSQESMQNRNGAWQSSQGSSQNANGTWQSGAQESGQGTSGAWQSAQGNNQSVNGAWQSAQGNSQSADGTWQQASGQTAGQQVSGSAQENSQRMTGGWAPRKSEFHHASHQRPEHEKRNGHSLAGKIAGVTAAAVLFGTVAGGTMFAVNTTGEYLKGHYTTIGQTETQAQVKVAQSDDDGSSTTAGAPVTSAIQTDVSSIVEKAMPSVVAINNTMLMQQQTWFGPSQTVEVPSSGSGIIVGQNDEELLIVTNNHVVEDSKELTVTFIDNQQVSAAIKGTDSETDLAVIAIPLKDIPADTMSQIKVATLGDSDALKVGQGVIAIGNALGYGQSVTVGYVSALNREVKAEDQTSRKLLQTDAAINPGNSGGALLNMKGEVIGINAAKYSSTEVEGMGYAIPISQAQDIINELMNKKTRVVVDEAEQGYLGIQGQNIDETAASMYGMPRGIYVYKIVEDSAASQSDLREKDIITKFDGQTVRTMADLKDMLTYYKGGDTVNLTVQSLENGQYVERTVGITLGNKPASETN